MRAEALQRVAAVALAGAVALVAAAEDAAPYGLFDFLGDMVEIEGEWVDPLELGALDEPGEAGAVEGSEETETAARDVALRSEGDE